MVQEADGKAKQALLETIAELKALEKDVRIIENQKDNLITELRSIVTDISEKVNRIEAKSSRISFDSKVNEVKSFLEQRAEPPRYATPENESSMSYSHQVPVSPLSEPGQTPQPQAAEPKQPNSGGSFFDEIGS
jgi:uncharacterized protein YoxC